MVECFFILKKKQKCKGVYDNYHTITTHLSEASFNFVNPVRNKQHCKLEGNELDAKFIF